MKSNEKRAKELEDLFNRKIGNDVFEFLLMLAMLIGVLLWAAYMTGIFQ